VKLALCLLIFVAGAGLSVQIGLNAAIRTAFGSSEIATLVNFLVGLAGLVALMAVTRTALPDRAAFAAAPPWAWFGGLLGAFYVATAAMVGPRIGAGPLLALTVLGQLVASLVIDQYGLLGFGREPLSPTRVVGAALLFAGVWLMTRR